MKSLLRPVIVLIIAAMAVCSCEDETLTIGDSLTSQKDKISAEAVSFSVPTETVQAGPVVSWSNHCYLGMVEDPDIGGLVTNEFSTQFNLLESFQLAPADSIISQDNGYLYADSCDLILYLDEPYNKADSLMAVKIQALELKQPASGERRYYTDYDPMTLVRPVDEGGIAKSKVFTYKDLTESDSLRSTSSYLPSVKIPLNNQYIDREGISYNNYGTYIIQQYKNHPEKFVNSWAFTNEVCPGFFFRIVDGLGFQAKVSAMALRYYYQYKNSGEKTAMVVMAGTREVLQTAKITNDATALQSLVDDHSCTYLKSPAGLYTRIDLPINNIRLDSIYAPSATKEQLIARYESEGGYCEDIVGIDSLLIERRDTLVGAKLAMNYLNKMTAIGDNTTRSLNTPNYVLMVQADSLKPFFEQGKLIDNATSTYTSRTYYKDNSYTFTNISNILTTLWQKKMQEVRAMRNDTEAFLASVSDTDWQPSWPSKAEVRTWPKYSPNWALLYEQIHPNWNKMLLVPIAVTTTSETTVTSIDHDMSLTSTKLVGGVDNPNAVKIDVVYAKFSDQ